MRRAAVGAGLLGAALALPAALPAAPYLDLAADDILVDGWACRSALTPRLAVSWPATPVTTSSATPR